MPNPATRGGHESGGAASDADDELVNSSWDEEEVKEEGEYDDADTGPSESEAEEDEEADEADEEEHDEDGEEDDGTAERDTDSHEGEDDEAGDDDEGSPSDAPSASHMPSAAAGHTADHTPAASPFAQPSAPQLQPSTTVWGASVAAPAMAKSAFTTAPGPQSVSSAFGALSATAAAAAPPPPAPSAFAASPLAEAPAPAPANRVLAFPSSTGNAAQTTQPAPAFVPMAAASSPAPHSAAAAQPQHGAPAAPTGSLHFTDFDRTLGQKNANSELRRPRSAADEADEVRRTLARYELVFPTDKLDGRIDEALYGA